ncbi:hypothetical protein J4Q44_G00089320 [Coregonus suidteri]|uniref:Uncharacterized protein n=1 Tax=Coregonus suidteri TaxID=861788 RepID=A0AAN8M8Q1_9TELE
MLSVLLGSKHKETIDFKSNQPQDSQESRGKERGGHRLASKRGRHVRHGGQKESLMLDKISDDYQGQQKVRDN